MFKVKVFENIIDFEFSESEILTLDTNNKCQLISKVDFSVIEQLSFEEKIQNNIKFENDFILNDIYGKGYLIENHKKKAFDFYLLKKENNLILGIKNGLFLTLNLNTNREKIIPIPKSLVFFLEDNILYTRQGKRNEAHKLNSYDLYNDKHLWVFDLNDLGLPISRSSNNPKANWKIVKIIGTTENDIWLALNHHTIISLNKNNGGLTNHISEIPTLQCEWLPSAIPKPENSVIRNDKVFGLAWEFIWEINSLNGEVEFQDLTKELISSNSRNDLNNFCEINNKIVFVSKTPSKINLFDIKSKKIVWEKEFDKVNNETPIFNNLKGNKSMFGVLGLNRKLFIYY